jgi:outer membrane protein assembly factor BamE (lipoprotein component of BamABCDE complex)
MKIVAVFITVGAMTALSAHAGSAEQARSPKWEKLEHLQAGLEKDDVRRIAGRPDVVTGSDAKGGQLWIYDARNEFGELAEYDVEFDAAGRVVSITSFDSR